MGNIATQVSHSFRNAGITWNNGNKKEPTDTPDDKTENNQTSLGNPVTKMINQIKSSFIHGHGISWEEGGRGGRGHIQTTEELVEAYRELQVRARGKEEEIHRLEGRVRDDSGIIDLETDQGLHSCLPHQSGWQNTFHDCKYCNFEANSSEGLLFHNQEKHGVKEQIPCIPGVRCHLCGLSYKEMEQVRHHLKLFHRVDELDDVKVKESEISAISREDFSGAIQCNYCSFKSQVPMMVMVMVVMMIKTLVMVLS